MVPIPPPPLPQGSGHWAPPSLSNDDRSGDDALDGLLPGQMVNRWRLVLEIGWVLIIITVAAVGGGSDRLGKPTWWLDPPILAMIPLLPAATAVLFSLVNSRRAVLVGWVASVVLAVTAALDLANAPGAAAIEAVLAVAGVLISTSSIAGRLPR